MIKSPLALSKHRKPRGWLVVTSGLGSPSFEAAARRVASQAAKLPNVVKVVAVTTSDLGAVCPKTSKIFGQYQNLNHRGWGYWAFKSEIVNRGFNGYWGEFDGVIWIDSGCEVCINLVSKARFKRFQSRAIRFGATIFTLQTPEFLYTKRSLFNEFPNLDPDDSSNQIQATWFVLYGDTGKKIAKKWLEITLKNVSYSDDSLSDRPERQEFVRHTGDQSIFSLVCKADGVNPMKYLPAAGSNSMLGRIRGLSHPIWVSRNRTGESILPRFLQ